MIFLTYTVIWLILRIWGERGKLYIIIKFSYSACSDWLKQCALSEIREPVDDNKLALKFLLRNFNKFDPN